MKAQLLSYNAIKYGLLATVSMMLFAPGLLSVQDVGYLWVTSKPNAILYLDGVTISRTPIVEFLQVSPGRHKIALVNRDYGLYEEEVIIKSGLTLHLHVQLAKPGSESQAKASKVYVESYLTVKSEPPGADVYLDEKPIGKTPLRDYPVVAQSGEPRDRNLKITKPGYEPYESKIRWMDMKNRVKFYLPIVSLQPLTPESQTSSSRQRSPLLSVLLVVCITLSVAIITWIIKTRLHKQVKGVAKPGTLFPVSRNGKWGYADRAGNVVIRTRFADAGSFSEGRAYVSIRPKWSLASKYGYIDEGGEIVIAPQFDHAWDFSEGLACIEIAGKYGYIDTTGRIVSGLRFDWAGDISEGMAWVRVSSKYIHITKDLLEQGALEKEFTEFVYPHP